MLTSLFTNTLLCLSLTRLIILSIIELELKFFTKEMSINKAFYQVSKIQNEKANLNQLIKIILKTSSIVKTRLCTQYNVSSVSSLKPHFSKTSLSDMPTFSIIYIPHSPLKLKIAIANNQTMTQFHSFLLNNNQNLSKSLFGNVILVIL